MEHFCRASRRVQISSASCAKARGYLRDYYLAKSGYRTLDDFLRTSRASALRARFLPQPFPQNVTFRSNLLPLKAFDPATGEKGVLILKFNYLFEAFHALYDTDKLREFYRIVLEPSFQKFEEPAYTLFDTWGVVLQSNNPIFQKGMAAFNPPFASVSLTSADWTDSETFFPNRDVSKSYDLIYVANWSRNKAHEVLFRALRKIGQPLRVALVGFPWERDKQAIVAEMEKLEVASQCEIFEKVPHEKLNTLFNLSKVNLLLSRSEGGNKALYEAMFAGVPSIVYRHCQGLDLNSINDQTGVLADDGELADAILSMLGRFGQFSPREWALKNTGYRISTSKLNDKLRELSYASGELWTCDIAPKVNSPSLAYKFKEDEERLRPALDHLRSFIRHESE